jgi:hypothetical protein
MPIQTDIYFLQSQVDVFHPWGGGAAVSISHVTHSAD